MRWSEVCGSAVPRGARRGKRAARCGGFSVVFNGCSSACDPPPRAKQLPAAAAAPGARAAGRRPLRTSHTIILFSCIAWLELTHWHMYCPRSGGKPVGERRQSLSRPSIYDNPTLAPIMRRRPTATAGAACLAFPLRSWRHILAAADRPDDQPIERTDRPTVRTAHLDPSGRRHTQTWRRCSTS